MISFDEALRCVSSVAHPSGAELVPIEAAHGRVLARPVVARIASPRSDVSAMDGYAVRDADIGTLPAGLRVCGTSFPGAGWGRPIADGECVRIFTGAPIPERADRIVIQENVRRDGDYAVMDSLPGAPRFIRKRGGDFGEGDELLPAGRLLDARAIVAAAGADLANVEVFIRPRTAILSTGDELAPPGHAFERRDAISDSVSLGIAALVEDWGGIVAASRRLPDNLEIMEKAAAEVTAAADVVIVTGGASVGDKDFARTMFEPSGLDILFSKVAIRPGKPAWLAKSGKAIVIGLPGNPTSGMVTARLLLAPLLAGLSGRDTRDALRWRTARLADPLQECDARETFHRARIFGDRVSLLSFQDSHAQKTLAEADVLVRHPAHSPALRPDSEVTILDF